MATYPTIEHLARLDRPPCSEGEREAAEWIAARLGELGCDARVEPEHVHGTFTWPLGVLAAIGAAGGLAALRGRRRAGLLAGALAAAGIWQDLGGGFRRPLRGLLPRGTTHNVVAETGDPDARPDARRARPPRRRPYELPVRPAPDPIAVGASAEARGGPRPLAAADGLVIGGPALVALGSLSGSRRPDARRRADERRHDRA